MDEKIREAAQELVKFLNEEILKKPEEKTDIVETLTGVERWVRVFNGDAEALMEYHKRWTKLAKLIAIRDRLPK